MKQLPTNEPLLYVDQPELQNPKSHMQSEFKSHKSEELPNNNQQHDVERSTFKHLSIEEKINYLAEIPHGLFQMRCRFETKDKTYYGVVTAKNEESIDIVHSGRQRVTVNIADIEHIHLIGL